MLFHGQAAVETGFSVNKDYLVENLQEESLIALRFVYDHMNENNETAANISITNELLNCYRGTCTAYAQALEEKQKQKGVDEKVLKRKRIEEKLREISLKKQKLSQSIEKDTVRADKFSLEAEHKKDFSLLHMGNSLKDVIKNNKEELKNLVEEEKKSERITLK